VIDAYDENSADQVAALASADDATLAREIRPALIGIAAILRMFHAIDQVRLQEIEILTEATKPPRRLGQ
jgi:hypothetical protein